MNTITNLHQQAQLSEAAYANLWNSALQQTITSSEDVKTALQAEGMSATQASEFVSQWSVVDHLPNTGNGFSATVFKNIATGKYEFAIRGSENIWSGPGAVDWGDGDFNDIGGHGIAVKQGLDLYNYWRSLNTAAGASYQAAYLKTKLRGQARFLLC